ncbi:MAG TPA: gamma-glutamyltransferase [Steroidobacteraceae bacterium]|nr:gamma-glutamyltransferase [Steroidobacteraceae bacterium]
MPPHPLARTAWRALPGAVLLAWIALFPPAIAVAADAATGARHAAVAAPDEFGARTAMDVMRRGGNAVDAAVATAFVLAVTYPEAGNLGGGGFMMIYERGQGSFLDYRETAPAAATRDMYLDEHGEVIKDASVIGPRAAGVPGTVAGLWAAHQRYGRRPWRELLRPAIALARDGFIVPAALAGRIQDARGSYAGLTDFDRYFGAVRAGERFRQPELAATLERIAARGPDGFYRGRTAQRLVAQMGPKGLVTLRDLAGYRVKWREPLTATWRGLTLLTAPLPSSGGFALIELLRMHDVLAPQFAGLEHNSTQYVHLIAEMEKRVFADRAEYLGDPDFVHVPIEKLIAPDYIARRAAEVRPHEISPVAAVKPGLAEGMHTTHFSILDADGNAVANTYTLNDWFGDGVVVDGAGFLLNNEMDDFSAKPGTPNLYGVIGGAANAIEPGKRMLSSMSPTIALRDGHVALVVGTPGGSTIFTSVFQTMLNIYDFHMSAQQAVAAGRFHHQLLPPDRIVYSICCALGAESIAGLRALGYNPQPSPWEFGDVQAILVDEAGQVSAGSDPRGRGRSLVETMPR